MVVIGGWGGTSTAVKWEQHGELYNQTATDFDLTTTEFRVVIDGNTIEVFANCTEILEATNASRINKLGFSPFSSIKKLRTINRKFR